MKRLPENLSPIERFPIPWSDALPALLGSLSFRLDLQGRDPVPQEWLGIVSSHNSKHGYASQDWQESLRSALCLAHRQGWGVLCAHDAPYSEVVFHACKRFHVPFLVIRVANWSEANQPAKQHSTCDGHSGDCGILWIACPEENSTDKILIHDMASVFLANQLFVIELRESGKIAQLLESRLSCQDIPPGTTYLSLPTTHAPKFRQSTGTDWLDRGAIGWLNTRNTDLLDPRLGSDSSSIECGTLARKPYDGTHQPIFRIRLLGALASKYLVHCTRARRGPWPDQSISQFHDDLMQNPWNAQPTVLETLQRILKQQRLIATNTVRRGNTDTICFSSNEITELLSMRKFQSHLSRWDWEPYGIMIDRDWLESNGAKQVSYIDRITARKTSDDALAYCQVLSNESNSADWRKEREWRIAGDVRLGQVPFSKAIVFVPTLADAKTIQPLSRWPIVVTSPSATTP